MVRAPKRPHAREEHHNEVLIMMMGRAADSQAPEQAYTPEDAAASWAHMKQIWQELAESGEWLATERLAGPQAAKLVTSDGPSTPSDQPTGSIRRPRSSGRVLDGRRPTASSGRSRIAARTSAAPGPGAHRPPHRSRYARSWTRPRRSGDRPHRHRGPVRELAPQGPRRTRAPPRRLRRRRRRRPGSVAGPPPPSGPPRACPPTRAAGWSPSPPAG